MILTKWFSQAVDMVANVIINTLLKNHSKFVKSAMMKKNSFKNSIWVLKNANLEYVEKFINQKVTEKLSFDFYY
jgi:hypothetical protein